MPTSQPSAWIFFTRSAMNASFAGSMHSPVSRFASTSPESFRRMRLYLSLFFTATILPFFAARRNPGVAEFAFAFICIHLVPEAGLEPARQRLGKGF